ncbi:NIF family HAD-type phosphatase [Aquimarina litoralis]|uniref:NIF family HAD-type phosphatase n=1 Tax=Aquimarina litoralis TaxID=584605 RepID=UPI001C5601B3|nr:HAD family hydrolase [Aquimarina litoralis]MBW1296304.1 phosphoprotein phosphatase [Aquimarina litoralis]
MNNKQKILLILDLDETLIHATETKLEIDPDFKYAEYFVYKRPNLEEFLNEMTNHFALAIWSSADDKYVSEIVDIIRPNGITFQFIWARSRCTLRRDYELDRYVREKRLKKIKKQGFPLEKALIVDDSPEKTRDNFGNAIYVNPFEGNPEDKELIILSNFLKSIKNSENVRTIEKRGWRNKIDL